MNPKQKATVKISRVRASHDDDFMTIGIEDKSSGLGIVEVKMTLEDFADALTNQFVTCEMRRLVSLENAANLGKTKEVVRAGCRKVWDKEEQKQIVQQDFENNYQAEGWAILSDGTTSRQDGKDHKYSLVRYVDQEVSDGDDNR